MKRSHADVAKRLQKLLLKIDYLIGKESPGSGVIGSLNRFLIKSGKSLANVLEWADHLSHESGVSIKIAEFFIVSFKSTLLN